MKNDIELKSALAYLKVKFQKCLGDSGQKHRENQLAKPDCGRRFETTASG
jgi:hypothetical protein